MTHLISIAPMMDRTDRHERFFLRLISPNVLLYTEMMTTGMLIHGDSARFLEFHSLEHPIALQLGGSEPDLLAEAAKIGERYGYDEINLNVGCPSDRVKKGRFGACLMLEPQLVADCIHAMKEAVAIPITVKCRIGVDHEDSFEKLLQFMEIVQKGGCRKFIIHARKAWLDGLSPKQNREIPPLRYDIVQKVKIVFPELTIILNGGIRSIPQIDSVLETVDGVMVGREAYSNPYFLAEVEKKYYPETTIATRVEIIKKLIPYIEEQLNKKIRLSSITRHILGLFHGEKGARQWRRFLSEAPKEGVGTDLIAYALTYVS